MNNKLLKKFEDRLMPVELGWDDKKEKKTAKFPKTWNIDTDFSDQLGSKNSLALRTGEGVVVIDIDTKDPKNLSDQMKKMVWKYIFSDPSKETLVVETTHGFHIYFETEITKSFKNNVRVSQNVDIRAKGGCVFVDTDHPKLSYTQHSKTSKVQKLPKEFEKLMAKPAEKVTEYKYDNGVKLNMESREPNKALFDTVGRGNDIKAVIKAAGMSPEDDFCKGSMYVDFNKFAFILANEPSIENEYVESILDVLIEDILGFDPESRDSIKMKNQSLGNMIWSSEYVEPEDDGVEFDDEIKDKIADEDLIRKFFKVDMVDKDLEVIESESASKPLIFKGALISLYGLSGTYKTATAVKVVGEACAKSDLKGFLLDGELNGGVIEKLCLEAKIDYIPADIGAARLKKFIKNKVDCSKVVFILDSFSRMIDGAMSNNDSQDTTKVMEIAQELTTKLGATVIVVEHGTALEYDQKTGTPKPISAKMQGNEEGKKRLTDFTYKCVPNGDTYEDGVTLHVMKTRSYKDLSLYDKVSVDLVEFRTLQFSKEVDKVAI